ncbi:Hypothetical predicted protein [Mytilus galloprovincialis]|uniref:DNA-directed DNA polymerase n=1 Tax=Mytilus galloprovincialis TaxID=29158 RepID=A0A8B6EVM4_MYTGA|nr:Hypothetical predicted protein [Mytilus galloprovincialis]
MTIITIKPENVEIIQVCKQVPHLKKQIHYTLHGRNLKQYLSFGMKLTKVNRIIRFDQSAWVKKYIDTNLRAKDKTDSEKEFFKLMNNSVFGKTMENICKRVDVNMVTSKKQTLHLVAKPNFDCRVVFTVNLVAVHMKKCKLEFNKHIYLDKFDTSNYAGEHSSGITIGVNKKTNGRFKDEFGGNIMKEFVVHRAKMYAYKVDKEVTKKQRELTKCDQA